MTGIALEGVDIAVPPPGGASWVADAASVIIWGEEPAGQGALWVGTATEVALEDT